MCGRTLDVGAGTIYVGLVGTTYGGWAGRYGDQGPN